MEENLEKMRGNVPQFIMKLYLILEKPQFENYITWFNENEIVIKNCKKLEQKVLPCFFRHKHTASFIRQLNMYKFSKVTKLTKQKNHLYFKNQNFKRWNIEDMYKIKRTNQKKKEIQNDSSLDNQHILKDYQHSQLYTYKQNVEIFIKQMANILNQLSNQSELLNKELHVARNACQKLMEIQKQLPQQIDLASGHYLGQSKNHIFSFRDVLQKGQSLQFFPSQCSIEHAI